jgi:hypothetical protein
MRAVWMMKGAWEYGHASVDRDIPLPFELLYVGYRREKYPGSRREASTGFEEELDIAAEKLAKIPA